MLVSSFEPINRPIFTPQQFYYLKLGRVCTEIHRFADYALVNRFTNFVQSVVNDRCQGDENPNSGVAADFMKKHAHSSQFAIKSNSVTRYIFAEKTHAAINKMVFRRLGISTNNFMGYNVPNLESNIKNESF